MTTGTTLTSKRDGSTLTVVRMVKKTAYVKTESGQVINVPLSVLTNPDYYTINQEVK